MTPDEPTILSPGRSRSTPLRHLKVVDGGRATALARQAALTELATVALLGTQQRPLLTKAARLVQDALDAGSCGVYEYLPGGQDLLLRAAAFAPGEHRRPATVDLPAAAQDHLAAHRSMPASTALMVPIGRSASFGFVAARRDEGGFDPDARFFATQVADILAAALERLRSEETRRLAALQDPLTGLPNRALIMDHLRLALARNRRRPSNVGVLFVDLDRFKVVNDSLGHQAGDLVLVTTGERLRVALRPPDTIGRLGGDEFVAVCEDIGGEADALAVAERLAASLEAPMRVAGRDVRIRASIGVALSASQHSDPAVLLAEADGAMFWAKRSGSGVALFEERMRVGTEDVQPAKTPGAHGLRSPDAETAPDPGHDAGGRLIARLVGLLENIEDPERLDIRDSPRI
ncbi:MAG TPA: sensor domain-containing diguanylate cyclase [Acidimicrobiia bacterium]|nr:sensor domain-containing diguanylate cyclase [Acidimicrobiia bacterium]